MQSVKCNLLIFLVTFLHHPSIYADRVILKKHNSNYIEGIVIEENPPSYHSGEPKPKAYKIYPVTANSGVPSLKKIQTPKLSKNIAKKNEEKNRKNFLPRKQKHSRAVIAKKSTASSLPTLTVLPTTPPIPVTAVAKAEGEPVTVKEADLTPPTGLATPTSVAAPLSPKPSSPTSSFGLGVNYAFPMLHYQYAITPHLSLGLSGILMDYSTSTHSTLKGFGGLLSLNYYEGGGFEGLWMEAGAGLYQVNLSDAFNSENKLVQAFLAHAGWRWKWENGPSFGFAAGAQYLAHLSSNNIAVGTSGFFPSLVLEIAFLL